MAHFRFDYCKGASACPRRTKKEGSQVLGRSAGGPTTKIHLICDAHGNPYHFLLSAGSTHDVTVAPLLLDKIDTLGDYVIADRGYDADWFRQLIQHRGAHPVIPGRRSRRDPIDYDADLYQARSLVEHAFCRLKQFRSVATRYEKLTRNFAGMVFLACIWLWLRL